MAQKRIHLLLIVVLALLILCALGWLIIPKLTCGSLLIDAQMVLPSGETQAVARETFYLLDSDMIMLAMTKGNESSPVREKVYSEHPNLGMVAQVMDARRRNAYSLGAEVIQFIEQSRPLWEPRVIKSAQTDAQGRAIFNGLKPGDYWLMGRTQSTGGAAFWNQRVSVGRGDNKITLDQTNALYMKSP
jgi:hypothetical protein